MKVSQRIKELEQKIADFGYGEMQHLDSHGWNEIKKSIMASHKSSKYSKVTVKPMKENHKFCANHSGAYAECYVDIPLQFDSDADPSLHSATARVKITLGDEISVMVQTRYNQA